MTLPVLVSRHLANFASANPRRQQAGQARRRTLAALDLGALKMRVGVSFFFLAIMEMPMGGFGSGHRHRAKRKITSEEALGFGIVDLPLQLVPGMSGVLTWTKDGDVLATAGYQVRGTATWLALSLHYQSRGKYTHVAVRLQTTQPHFGSSRWWLTCPSCYHRVGKLYRIPSNDRFACRKCNDLTYKSSQDAHKHERLMRSMAKMRGKVAARGWCQAESVKSQYPRPHTPKLPRNSTS
jgi:hypothetical protein